ncbi:hypothetical protein GQ472_00265 [archaeon]|nr:hypothetical protein [archaeon]
MKQLKTFIALFHSLGKQYLDVSKEISDYDLTNLSDEEIKELYLRYQKIAIEYSLIGPFVAFVLAEYWFAKMNPIVKNTDPDIRAALFRPIKHNSVVTLNEKASKIDVKDTEAVKRLWEEYRWLSCLDIHKVPWTLKGMRDFIKKAEPIKHPKYSFEEALNIAGLKDKKDMFEMIRELAYIRDARDDYRRKGVFNASPLFDEIAKRAGITHKQVAYLTENEIIDFLECRNIIGSSVLDERKKGFLLYANNGNIICKEGNVEKEIKHFGIEIEALPVSLKGTVGCSGRTTGTVKIVRTIHDIIKVEDGDILVAVVTHPDYVIAMRKAAAIVTDEGGALSHAAIVSREMGIPCIVGTGMATRALKNGDMVSVDANRGIVKKLKRLV